MILLNYRIRRLQEKVAVQRAYLDKLEEMHKEYQQSYYTDWMLREMRVYLELNSKLMWLKANYEKNSKLQQH